MTQINTNIKLVWLPTAEQELLLKAALFTDESAITFWRQWIELKDPRQVELAERRLFPLVYHNLQTIGFNDQYTELLKETHRDSFRNTISLLQIASTAMSHLNAEGIRTILLKGIPLAVKYYPSPALRPMSDIDLMVQPDKVLQVSRILYSQGWKTQEKNLSLVTEVVHSCQFLNSENEELDLHWRLMRDCWNADKNEIFWESADTLNWQNLKSESICATDQLFHVCCHGAKYNDVSPIRWIPDALMILNSAAEIDWTRILGLGKTYRLTLPLLHTLRYLKTAFDASIPSDVLQSLEETPTSRLERMSFRHFSEPPKQWTIWRFAQEAAFQFSSLRSSTNLTPRTLVFVKYLRHFLTLEKLSKKISQPR